MTKARASKKASLWNLDFIFPNLNPSEPYEAGPFCLCSGKDSRLTSLAPGPLNDTALALLRRHKTTFGTPYVPGVLLTRDGSPKRTMRGNAVRDFRNSCALATIEASIAIATTATGSLWLPFYGDHFFFGNHIPLKDGWVGTLSAIVEGTTDEVHKFCGHPSPHVELVHAFKTAVDPVLLSRLLAVWKMKYQGGRSDYKIRKLFRSFVVAFQASRFPSDGLPSVNDVGLRIATWVSAFEILLHPGTGGTVTKRVVLDAIGNIRWASAKLNSRGYRLRCDGKPYAGTFAQAAYDELYRARNKFLHGEKVVRSDQHLRRSPRRIPLAFLAPLLFGATARQLLDEILKTPLTDEQENDEAFLGLGKLDEALIEIQSGKPFRPLRARNATP